MMLRTKQAVIDRLKSIQQDRHWNEISIQNLEEQIAFLKSGDMTKDEERQLALFEMSIEMYEEENSQIDKETNNLLDELNLLNDGK